MVWNRERAEHARDGRAALVAVRVGVGREQIERARGRDLGAQLRAAREPAARVDERVEDASEGVVRADGAEADYLLQARVEVRGREAHAVRR